MTANYRTLVLAIIVILIVIGTPLLILHPFNGGNTRQEMVHMQGQKVMPFDLGQTKHHFRMLPDGGLQRVTVNDPSNTQQLAMIRMHLQMEATNFAKGDFSDPAAIHGGTMTGLDVLSANASKITFTYSDLPDGASILYKTNDPQLVDAIHQFFQAQLSDHGSDAVND